MSRNAGMATAAEPPDRPAYTRAGQPDDPSMSLPTRLESVQRDWIDALRLWWGGWWQIVHFGAQILVLALAPSSWRASQRRVIVQRIYLDTRPLLPGFIVLSALAALVIIRIVLATSLSYGLSRYALDVLVRTLVLELIPLSAALFVAVRMTLAAGDEVRVMRAEGRFEALLARGIDPTRDLVLPRVVSGLFAVVTLAALSGVVTLLLTYLLVYGFTSSGLPAFTRTVGQVFNPVIALIFALKTVAFSLAVSIIPMVTTPRERLAAAFKINPDLTRLARMLAVVLLVEVLSLVGNYY
jgi:phospholipid/cholesterol/gamma-HCH transport system permease protein